MRVRIKPMGELKDRLPDVDEVEVSPSATIRQILEQLQLAPTQLQMVMLNGRPAADRDRSCQEGDELTLLPPVGGG